MTNIPPSGPETVSSESGYETSSQLEMLIFLVSIIGVAISFGPIAKFVVGVVCLGIAVISLSRLYRREFP